MTSGPETDPDDSEERRVFFDNLNAAFARLRQDPVAWREIEAERAIEAGALRDRSV
jgi:hypothetical protein